MRVAIVIHEGLGNTLLLIPLIKKLKEAGKAVTGIFTSKFNAHELFTDIPLFKEKIIIKQNADYIKVAAKYVQRFDEIYLDWFASTRKNMVLANSISKKIITNRIPEKLPSIMQKRIRLVDPLKNIHEVTQNLMLFDSERLVDKLDEELLSVTVNKRNFKIFDSLPEKYAVVQISAGNNKAKYKTWPMESWIAFFNEASHFVPDVNYVLLGDENETSLAEKIISNAPSTIISLVGKTTINEAVHIVNKSSFYLGIDSGFMHLAVNLGKPTFTIWGASDYNLFGYKKLDSQKHQLLYKKMPCHPCNSYLNPNQTRVNNPNDCPDFKCIRNITPHEALEHFQSFLQHNYPV